MFRLKFNLTILFFLSVNYGFAQLNIITTANYDSLLNVNADYRLVPLKSDYIKEQIMYATNNNFTKGIVYDTAAVYLSIEARNALHNVVALLKPLNVGLIIYDAYRPYRYTVKFWEIIHDDRYVADPKKGSRHNRGCAVM